MIPLSVATDITGNKIGNKYNRLSSKAVMSTQLFVCEIIDFTLSSGSKSPLSSPSA